MTNNANSGSHRAAASPVDAKQLKPYTRPVIKPLGGFRERTLADGSGAPDTNQTKGRPT